MSPPNDYCNLYIYSSDVGMYKLSYSHYNSVESRFCDQPLISLALNLNLHMSSLGADRHLRPSTPFGLQE
jgi:hypothetical protein